MPAIRPCVLTLVVLLACRASAGEGVERVGAGGYLTTCPAKAKEPQAVIYKTENIKGPVPTSDWWSSLTWVQYSEPQYAHPLVLRAEAGGLRVFHPNAIATTKIGIFAAMGGGKNDFVLGHSAQLKFPDARLHDFSDWFLTTAFAADGKSMKFTYGHGSPFVYAIYEGGNPTLTFDAQPSVWSGNAQSAVLGISVNTKAYALFGPAGCSWSGLDSKTITCDMKGKTHFSVALLPDKSQAALDLFTRHAYAHVTGSKVEWSFDEKTSVLKTQYTFTTQPHEGTETATLFALYPHQWMRSKDALTEYVYPSVRGQLKLMRGSGFSTQMTFPGVLPALPDKGSYDKAVLRKLVEAGSAKENNLKDTYWGGKRLGYLASLIPIAEQVEASAARDQLYGEMKERLEKWFTPVDAAGAPKKQGCFYLNKNWGTLIGYPASYGSDVELSDHHFHYGYFIRAAAEIARHDPQWAADENWGGMVRLLIRDIANPERNSPDLPFLRNFDPYAGHSWASGKGVFFDGNNQESSSEAMGAWAGIILFGQAVGDKKLRDLGIFLFTTEMEAINQYWFDVENRHRAAGYGASVVTMVWGAKGVNETWFTKNPEAVHAINWLPIHGGSLYLGHYPEYTRRNYDALVAENQGEKWDEWADQVFMYRALHDPADAIRQYNLNPEGFPLEGGNSRANAYLWIHNLNALGQVDLEVAADYPLYAVFKKNGTRTYVVYNMDAAARDVRFTDGTTFNAPPRSFAVHSAPAK